MRSRGQKQNPLQLYPTGTTMQTHQSLTLFAALVSTCLWTGCNLFTANNQAPSSSEITTVALDRSQERFAYTQALIEKALQMAEQGPLTHRWVDTLSADQSKMDLRAYCHDQDSIVEVVKSRDVQDATIEWQTPSGAIVGGVYGTDAAMGERQWCQTPQGLRIEYAPNRANMKPATLTFTRDGRQDTLTLSKDEPVQLAKVTIAYSRHILDSLVDLVRSGLALDTNKTPYVFTQSFDLVQYCAEGRPLYVKPEVTVENPYSQTLLDEQGKIVYERNSESVSCRFPQDSISISSNNGALEIKRMGKSYVFKGYGSVSQIYQNEFKQITYTQKLYDRLLATAKQGPLAQTWHDSLSFDALRDSVDLRAYCHDRDTLQVIQWSGYDIIHLSNNSYQYWHVVGQNKPIGGQQSGAGYMGANSAYCTNAQGITFGHLWILSQHSIMLTINGNGLSDTLIIR
jgi:hypothetical protein